MKKINKTQILEFIKRATEKELKILAIEMLKILTPKQAKELAPLFKEAILLHEEDNEDNNEQDFDKSKDNDNDEEDDNDSDNEAVSTFSPETSRILKDAEKVDVSQIPEEVRKAMLKENPKIFDDLEDIFPDYEDDEEDDS